MMKFLLLALMALSLGFAVSGDPQICLGEQFLKVILQAYYNVKESDMMTDCKIDMKNRWTNIEKAILTFEELTQSVVNDLANGAKKVNKVTDEVYENLIKARCMKNDSYQRAKLNVYKKALPCMKKDKLSAIMQDSMFANCQNIKFRAKKQNS
ncbi:uncharacterized protein LOC117178824 [Belonocnema kinseyi]|uniref:uncharacterized protein LOC117178824 n=1 Tax=Belonocnema kinseyi TaxID=2817044 RepID=UPI00143DB4B9|nr:uncharacterized protein LOC117178824 [Belonocnema kinseyi]